MGRPMMPRPMKPMTCAMRPRARRVGERLNGGRAAVKYHADAASVKGGRAKNAILAPNPPSDASGFAAPEILGEPVEIEVLQRLRQGLAGLAIVADPRVPQLDHLVPLGADRLALGRAVVGRRAIARGRLLNVGHDSAAQ